MVKRKKTKFENLFSMKRHMRRFGSGGVGKISNQYEELKAAVIDGGEIVQTRGSHDDVSEHFKRLRAEFSGQSELVYEHAKLIVLMRREVQPKKAFTEFSELWEVEHEFLLDKLNIRWLVAAADSFSDWDPDLAHKALAMSVSILVNTVKTYESERYITDVGAREVNADKVELLQTDLVPIFEGLSVLTIGTDDTLRNMRWRLDELAKETILGKILLTIFLRLQNEDTAFARLRQLHHRKRTAWW